MLNLINSYAVLNLACSVTNKKINHHYYLTFPYPPPPPKLSPKISTFAVCTKMLCQILILQNI